MLSGSILGCEAQYCFAGALDLCQVSDYSAPDMKMICGS